jgi:hypothetical protein
LNFFHFWIFNNLFLFFLFLYWRPFWKFKKKNTTLSDDLFLCQVSNGSAVRFPFSMFFTLVTMVTATILNVFNPPKSCHTLWWIFLQSFMKFDERNPKNILIPPFLFPCQLQQSLSNRFRFFFWLISFH